jgi:hypothetical protein
MTGRSFCWIGFVMMMDASGRIRRLVDSTAALVLLFIKLVFVDDVFGTHANGEASRAASGVLGTTVAISRVVVRGLGRFRGVNNLIASGVWVE